MPQTKTTPATAGITVVKGNLPPLSPQQRELVRIFVWYLRSLSKWQDADVSWESDEYYIVNRLLCRFFRTTNPEWTTRKGETRLTLDDLPETEADRYRELMRMAGSADTDPVIQRRQSLLRLAGKKRRLLEMAEYYEKDRKALGLPPDASVSVRRTPLEIAAEQTWPGQR